MPNCDIFRPPAGNVLLVHKGDAMEKGEGAFCDRDDRVAKLPERVTAQAGGLGISPGDIIENIHDSQV